MSQIENYLYTSDYGQRIIVRRVFLKSSDVVFENLYLLAELLNMAPCYTDKKLLSEYADGKATFKAYCYGGGYVFEGRLCQTQNKNLFFFNNPYKKGISVFNDIFELGFKTDEKGFLAAKERALANYLLVKKDPSKNLEGRMEINYAIPNIDEKLFNEVTYDDEKLLLKAIKSSTVGEYLFLGEKSKKDPLALLPKYQDDFSSLTSSYLPSSKSFSSADFSSEALTYLFKIKEIKTSHDIEVLKVSSDILFKAISLSFMKSLSTKTSYSMHVVNKETMALEIVAEGSRLSENQSYFLNDLEKTINTNNADLISSSLNDYALSQVELTIHSSKAIEKALLLQDLGISFESFFKEPDVKAEEVKESLAGFKEINKLTATILRGKTND
jgi:hypothetical protein